MNTIMHTPDLNTPFYITHAQRLTESFFAYLNKPLMKLSDSTSLIEQLWQAPFALVSHGVEEDPVFNFANQQALTIFDRSFEEFIQLPSRFSAEPVEREERARLLAEVTRKGYIGNYQGIRIAKSGQRFVINHAIVWNLYDAHQGYCGQAAMFDDWAFID